MYRTKSEMLSDRIKYKSKKSVKSWYKDRGYSAILNIPVTPHGTLKTNILRSLKRQDLGDDMKLLVREVPGQQVRHLVSNVKSFNMKNNCGRPRCFPCSSSK